MRKTICFALVVLCFYCVSCGKITENTGNDSVLNGFETEISDGAVKVDIHGTAADDGTKNESSGSFVGEGFEKDVTVYPIKLIRIDGKLYYDTGENSRMTPRCGTLDGEIQSRCDEYEVPGKDGEANFQSSSDYYGSGWQNASDSTKEVPTEDGWRIFKRVDMDSIFVYELKSCIRIVGDDREEIILSSEKTTFDKDGNAVYTEKKPGEKRITLPVRYGQVYDWGVTMSAKDVTDVGMTLVIKQSGGHLTGELGTGSEYELQKQNGRFWEQVKYAASTDTVAWDALAYIIPKDSEREFQISWEWLYGKLSSGKYMISKSLMDFRGTAGHDEHTFYLEFEIPESSVSTEELCGYPTAENTCPYALMHDGVMYYYTGEYIFESIEVSDEEILGNVTSVIPESGMPKEDGQANVPIEGSVFIKHELAGDGLLVLIDGKWYIFETRE